MLYDDPIMSCRVSHVFWLLSCNPSHRIAAPHITRCIHFILTSLFGNGIRRFSRSGGVSAQNGVWSILSWRRRMTHLTQHILGKTVRIRITHMISGFAPIVVFTTWPIGSVFKYSKSSRFPDNSRQCIRKTSSRIFLQNHIHFSTNSRLLFTCTSHQNSSSLMGDSWGPYRKNTPTHLQTMSVRTRRRTLSKPCQ